MTNFVAEEEANEDEAEALLVGVLFVLGTLAGL